MRRSSQDSLPLRYIQAFGMLVIAAITAAGILGQGDVAILGPVVAVVGGFVMAGGYFEKAKAEVSKALAPNRDDERRDS